MHPWPFRSCTSGCAGFLALFVSSGRCETDKDIELVVLRHQVRVLERQLHGRVQVPAR